MGWLRAILSWLSRGLLAILLGRWPLMTLSAESGWMRDYGDTARERALGARLCRWVNALPGNNRVPDHCGDACREHLAAWRGRLDRAAKT